MALAILLDADEVRQLRQTHYNCGNPAMIGAPQHDAHGEQVFPTPVGMIEILSRYGLCPDEKSHPGKIHYEKYW